MKLNTDEKIRLGMAFNNAVTILGEKALNAKSGKPNAVYGRLIRELYTLYTEEVKYQEDLHDEERRKKDEISKKASLEAAQEIGNEDA